MARRPLVPAALSRARQYPVRENGLIEIPEELREYCAAFTTGRFVVQAGKQFDPQVLGIQRELAEAFGIDPRAEQASPQQIADLYLAAGPAGGEAEEQERHKRYVAKMLKDAADMSASDVKVIRRSRQTDVRFAVAGREIDYGDSISVGEGRSIIAYLFDARDEGSGHTTKQQHSFQSFSITPGLSIQLPERIQKIRGQKGFHEGDSGIQEHVALRVVYDENEDVVRLDDLGFDPLVLADLRHARDIMGGGVIVGGETGDGKSTTILRSAEKLYDENEGQVSIVTVEDPVESRIRRSGIIQIPIQSAGSAERRTANYRAALMHFVRINPDVGVVSEVRDAEGARQMIQFIETGHQVWTTIHIGSVNSILFRMIDMGIQPSELAKPGSITLLMKQSLVPLLCACAIPARDGGPFRERNTGGCRVCLAKRGDSAAAMAWAGYRRLIAVGESIVPDEGYLDCVRRNDAIAAWRHWTAPLSAGGLEGMTLSRKIQLLASAGLVAPSDARKKGGRVVEVDQGMLDRYQTWIAGLAGTA